MSMPTKPESLRLRGAIRSSLWEILSFLADYQGRSLGMTCADAAHRLTLHIGPVHGDVAAGGVVDELFFSPMESAIVNAIGATATLIAKQIASAACLKLGTELKFYLKNLKARGVLAAGEGGQGYRWSEAYRARRKVVT